MRQKIILEGLCPQEIIKKYSVSKGTAYRCYKQGWIIPDYHKKEVIVGDYSTLDIAELYKMSKAVFWRHFANLQGAFQEEGDCLQEAVTRCLELSGRSQDKGSLWAIARNAMRSYLQKQKILRAGDAYRSITGMQQKKLLEGKSI